MMMLYEHAVVDDGVATPSPGSPPGMTASKSSKSSSFHSLSSDDGSVLADVAHFEEIGLDDDSPSHRHHHERDVPAKANIFNPSYPADLRASRKHSSNSTSGPRGPSSRDLARPRPLRDITSVPKTRPNFPSLQTDIRAINVRCTNTSGLYPATLTSPTRPKGLGPRNDVAGLPFHRHRSPSPNCSLIPRDPNLLMIKPRRSSWQSTRERKSSLDLERECDEDDGDDIPDYLVLDNVPISPRPPSERSRSQPGSKAASPERNPKERVRSVGNGTPPVAAAQGSLRSPTWKSDAIITSPSLASCLPISPIKSRAKSWSSALADLSAEAKELTEKLEEHATELDQKRSSTGSMPNAGRRSSADAYESKPRHKSALPELPPVRRTNIMIDPLPISKEKEAVLSRTRPSWLPPKDPAEERRHLREYQKMMAKSAEAEKRRETERRLKSECRDTAADCLMQIWEQEILPRWGEAIRERRTRELWWRGVAPRSRGAVWTRAIGNELGLTRTSYDAALRRAREAEEREGSGRGSASDTRHARWMHAIRKDVAGSTWSELKIFQQGAPLHQSLVDVLSAYAMYRSDIGYVPGCNTMAALLLLNLPSATDAFIALANVLNRPLPLSFYASDPGAKASAYNLVLQTLALRSPGLHAHLTELPDHDPDAYLSDVFTALFTAHLPLDAAARTWDVYVFEGDAVLVRAAVALLVENEMALLGAKTVAEVKAVLEGPGCASYSAGSSAEAAATAGNKAAAGTTAAAATAAAPKRTQRVVGMAGEEDQWISAVRAAGKA